MIQDINDLDDATLARKVLAGDREAFTPLLLRYYASVQKLCRRLLPSTWEAEDVAQEAALQAFLGISHLKDPTRFGAWFHAIAANLARKALRRRKYPLNIQHDGTWEPSWTENIMTPENAYDTREVHDAIISALSDLSPVNREIVIGFYLQGYRYDELAQLLSVPESTVRGRLFQARQHLRQTLTPIKSTHSSVRQPQKEHTMKESELVEMQRARFLFPFTPEGFASRTAIELRSRHNRQGFALYVSKAEGEILANLPNEIAPDQAANAGAQMVLQGLMFSMMRALNIQIKRIVVQRLVDSTFYATITILQRKKEKSFDARPGEALILATYTGAPIYTARSVLDMIGYDWADLISWITQPNEQQITHPQAYQDVKRRITDRIESEATQSWIHLAPDAQHLNETILRKLLADSNGQTAFLIDHRNGTLAAWCGSGDEHTLTQFSRICGCRAQSPQDLRELLLYSHFLIGEITQGAQMPFAQVGLYWQMNLVLSRDRDSRDVSNVISQSYYVQAIKELRALLSEVEVKIDENT